MKIVKIDEVKIRSKAVVQNFYIPVVKKKLIYN